MSQSLCTLSSLFEITGDTIFPGTAFEVALSLAHSTLDPIDILTCEWYLDGLLVTNVNGLQLSGEGYCGEHIVAARILTINGWSGLRTFSFSNCTQRDIVFIQEPKAGFIVKEGDTIAFRVIQRFKDHSESDVTDQYVFSVTGAGYFEGNTYFAAYNESLSGFAVEINASSGQGDNPAPILLQVQNIDRPVRFLSTYDYMVLRLFWQDGRSSGLDMLVGLENSNTVYNGQYVGYGAPSARIPTDHTQNSSAYLQWASDNMERSGEETVLFNLRQLKADNAVNGVKGDFFHRDFAAADFLVDDIKNTGELGVYAIWRGENIGTSFFNVELTTYKGGEMELQGTSYTNTGGNLVDQLTFNLSTTRINSIYLRDYYSLAKIRFDMATGRSTLFLYEDNS